MSNTCHICTAQVRGVKYLKDDPVIICWEGTHYYFCALAALGLLGMCVCVPLLIMHVTTAFHFAGSRVEQERVSLLTQSYRERYHYWEAIELTRKFLLTSDVLLVYPDTLVQLWFVDVVGLIFLILYLGAAPYRDCSSSRIQVAALVQLEFTYITATLFFDRDSNEVTRNEPTNHQAEGCNHMRLGCNRRSAQVASCSRM